MGQFLTVPRKHFLTVPKKAARVKLSDSEVGKLN